MGLDGGCYTLYQLYPGETFFLSWVLYFRIYGKRFMSATIKPSFTQRRTRTKKKCLRYQQSFPWFSWYQTTKCDVGNEGTPASPLGCSTSMVGEPPMCLWKLHFCWFCWFPILLASAMLFGDDETPWQPSARGDFGVVFSSWEFQDPKMEEL